MKKIEVISNRVIIFRKMHSSTEVIPPAKKKKKTEVISKDAGLHPTKCYGSHLL